MKKILLFLSLLLFALPAFSQQSWPEAFVIKTDSLIYQDLNDNNWQYINSGEKIITFKDIITPKYTKRFLPAKRTVSFQNQKSHIWLRYRLKNNYPHAKIISFTSIRDNEHIYISNKDKWLHFKSGDMIPWSKRDGIKGLNQVTYTLAANEEVLVYADLGEVVFYTGVTPGIGDYLKIIKTKYLEQPTYTTDDILSFGFFGFILFAVIFNLFFYYVNREKVYLVYSFLLLFSALLLAMEVFSSLLFAENREAYPFFIGITILGFIIMFIHTIRYFFRISIHFPNWDRFLIYSSVLIGIIGILIFVGYIMHEVLFLIIVCGFSVLIVLAFLVASIVMIISLLRKKDKEARIFVIAAVPFLVSPIIAVIVQWDWIVTTFGMWTILVLSWGMFARFKSLQIANARVALEKEEERTRLIAAQKVELEQQVADRTAELQNSIEELKLTQNQLIQSEKMASLGELTAGIAHEIQNPLNFVNNFSDVSVELLQELKEELEKGDVEEATAIADDVIGNLEKIAHHGRRADGIVKGMLQHSRASSGQKELTDINTLSDEYLRLAYHGLRAKDKSFNAELITHFEENLPKATVVPQDLGRVLLNLFTNAFYATQQQKNIEGEGFKPTVSITTIATGNSIEIRVKDNGTGIPDAIKDKILQPFFTTKPTGEGTGLGLSLSYDIVVKAHGGTIDIMSAEGKGSEFIITIPVG
ncbi:hypothetical protein FMM05_09645 [Flavobacterium zepuense]|uniref:histidine kinase n=1 Tax=Flavobacterium zepuense TaxID=2593302 RepID=A0A552V2R2_9FLAO|nr:sensor histidine kinase [Flavobacterium zepuense]TRW24755.1 hypothetical protein FMM05_09645 [Flavobacterium zepuense]